ncbi:MAG: GNAT family N-acetyltransferase [Candidatus Melainabacteria bacterium]|nr:GNAT family N-acetyltransferase [Candidatus Melainabacteria bacterium]
MNQASPIEAISILKVDILSIAKYRYQYLHELPFAQEFFVEGLAKNALCYAIYADDQCAGYALIHDHVIVEFYLIPSMTGIAKNAMTNLISETASTSSLCKSFDHLFLETCIQIFNRKEIVGYLYRNFETSQMPKLVNLNLVVEPVITSDLQSILSIDGQFFADEDEVKTYFEADSRIFKFTARDKLVGCGIIKQVIPGMNDYDIGYAVSPEHRQKGVATYIAVQLRNYCIEQGWNPIAGCSSENIASQKTLERAGFSAVYTLIKWSV